MKDVDLDALDETLRNTSRGENPNGGLEDRLSSAFVELKDHSDDLGRRIDVSAQVMRKVREPHGVLIPLLRWVPVAAAVVLVLFVAQQAVWAQPIQVSASNGVLVKENGAWVATSGTFRLEAPFALKSTGPSVQLQSDEWNGEFARQTELHIHETDRVEITRGNARFASNTETFHLNLPWAAVSLKGQVQAGVFLEHTMTRRTKVASLLGGAGAILAIYAGRAEVGLDGNARALTAPTGAIVDKSGRVQQIPLATAEEALSESNRRDAGRSGMSTPAQGTDTDGKDRTGGYWDAQAETVRFTLAGDVFDVQTGEPIVEFETELVGQQVRSFDAPTQRISQFKGVEDGQFRLHGLGLGVWRLTVRADGYAPSNQTVTLNWATDDPFLVVPLSQGSEISGTVTDWRGKPVAEASVTLAECLLGSTDKRCPRIETDNKGAFLLRGAPEGRPFTVHAQHPKYGFATRPNVSLREGETEHVQIQLSGILKVTGRVFQGSNKTPASGVQVKANEVAAATDDTGYYELLMPLEKRPEVRVIAGSPEHPSQFASYPDNRSAEPIRWVDAEDHVAVLSKDFYLAMESATLTGTITLADGTPAANALVGITNTMGWFPGLRGHETFPKQTKTDESGRYRIENIPAHAGYVLRLKLENTPRTLGTVVIEEPDQVVADFTVGSGTIRGRFIDRDSEKPSALDRQACARFGAHSVTDDAIYRAKCLADGSFEIKEVAPGNYRLGKVGSIHSEVEFGELTVELTESGKLAGVVVNVKGPQQKTWTVRATDASGRFIPGLMLRYYYETGSRTSSLDLSNEGTVQFTVPTKYTEVFLDAAGYVPAAIPLQGRDPSVTIETTMKRSTE